VPVVVSFPGENGLYYFSFFFVSLFVAFDDPDDDDDQKWTAKKKSRLLHFVATPKSTYTLTPNFTKRV